MPVSVEHGEAYFCVDTVAGLLAGVAYKLRKIAEDLA